jgi:hypothetical protein
MAHRIPMRAFMQALFADTTLAAQAAEIAQALLAARPLLLTDMAAKKRKGVNRGRGRSPPPQAGADSRSLPAPPALGAGPPPHV